MSMTNKIKSFNTVILLTVLVLLTGCLVGPDFEQPQFEDLPDEWVCPECAADKDMFVPVD